MRLSHLIAIGGAAALLAGPAAVMAQTARNSPDDIVCRLSGSCGGSGADASQQIKVGDEKAFSLARPSAAKPTTATPSGPSTTQRFAIPTKRAVPKPPVRPATSSGGIDMLITFPNGSADLTEQGKAEARAFAQALGSPALAGMRFTIDGHTNATGSRDLNLDLSKRRADAVAAYLASLGVDGSRLETKGYGFDKPRPGTSPRAGINRRVEFAKVN
jgi:outer membrane protein OmpA-like peptidoglycan-associated protein